MESLLKRHAASSLPSRLNAARRARTRYVPTPEDRRENELDRIWSKAMRGHQRNVGASCLVRSTR
mgnify:CR=1 FL=1